MIGDATATPFVVDWVVWNLVFYDTLGVIDEALVNYSVTSKQPGGLSVPDTKVIVAAIDNGIVVIIGINDLVVSFLEECHDIAVAL